MNIDLYANDGSPLSVIPEDIYNSRGVGGAELAMLTWAKVMAARGHRVRIFNNPRVAGVHDGVEFHPQSHFSLGDGDRDVFVVFRSPNPHIRGAKARMKVHWSTDQYTVGDYATDIFPHVDRVVCISSFHVNYFGQKYGMTGERIGHIDLGVLADDYQLPEIEKVAGRCIFCSVPDRGLSLLARFWPEIKAQHPQASLVVTSDYSLWGGNYAGNHRHRLEMVHLPGVIFLGKIPRRELIKQQLRAMALSYPCLYEELFCLSVAECQVAGAVPVTPAIGSLATTNKWGLVVGGNPISKTWRERFIEGLGKAFALSAQERQRISASAIERFSWNRICAHWENLFETGGYPQ